MSKLDMSVMHWVPGLEGHNLLPFIFLEEFFDFLGSAFINSPLVF